MTTGRARPLAGVTVIDLTSNVAAPFASAVLADLGADVIHVEGPSGDACRRMAPTMDGSSAYFQVVNRNKQGAVLDIRVEADDQVILIVRGSKVAAGSIFSTRAAPRRVGRMKV